MSAVLRAAFDEQSVACRDLGSPFMGQLCHLFATRLDRTSALCDRLFAWQGDLGPRGDSVPLRLCGALHALRLGGDPVLGAVYPPANVSDDVLWDAVARILTDHETFIDGFIDNPPQTNEVRRSCALIAAAHVIAAHFDHPLSLSELGASAGLNLNFDRFALQIGDARLGPTDAVLTLAPDWNGPLPQGQQPIIAQRRGVDLNPVAERLRLLAYLWPDQPERLELTNAALSLPSARVDQGDAIDWLAARLAPVPEQTHLIYTTIAWQYFPERKQDLGRALIEQAGANATTEAPLAFLQMENDGGARGAALTCRLWPGDIRLDLGRVDFHGRWVDWTG